MLPLSPPWTLHQLEAAYRQGYLEALLERQPRRPAHEILAASWEAGWRNGSQRLRDHRTRSEATLAASRNTLRPALRIRHLLAPPDPL